MTSSEHPSDALYTREHEWIRVDGDTVTVGISSFAQEALGDIVFVSLPGRVECERRELLRGGRVHEERQRRVCAGER